MAQILRSLDPNAYIYNSPAAFNLVALTPYVITVAGSANIVDVSLYQSSGEDISDGVSTVITANQVTFTSNVNINTLTAKVVYEL